MILMHDQKWKSMIYTEKSRRLAKQLADRTTKAARDGRLDDDLCSEIIQVNAFILEELLKAQVELDHRKRIIIAARHTDAMRRQALEGDHDAN